MITPLVLQFHLYSVPDRMTQIQHYLLGIQIYTVFVYLIDQHATPGIHSLYATSLF